MNGYNLSKLVNISKTQDLLVMQFLLQCVLTTPLKLARSVFSILNLQLKPRGYSFLELAK